MLQTLENKPRKNLSIKDNIKKLYTTLTQNLESLINKSAILAVKYNTKYITSVHIESAYSTTLTGYNEKERSYLKEKGKILASYHEAGHELVNMLLLPQDKVSKITIISTTK